MFRDLTTGTGHRESAVWKLYDRGFGRQSEAEVKWDGLTMKHPKSGTSVTIGDPSVSKMIKDGLFARAQYKTGDNEKIYMNKETTWEVTVKDKNITGNNPKVYDMLIHDTNVQLTDITSGNLLVDGNNSIDGISLSRLAPKDLDGKLRYLKYIDGSLKSDNSALILVAKPLTKDGRTVGYLIVASGFQPGYESSNKFRFDTTLVDPSVLIHQFDSTGDIYDSHIHTVPNRVYITKGGSLENTNTYYPKYISRMLEKEALSVTDAKAFRASSTAENANKGLDSNQSANAFDHVEKSVVYRLSVNAEGIKAMGNLIVKDTLPTGWELKKYTVFAGSSAVQPNTTRITTEADLKKQSFAGVKALGNPILQGTAADNSNPSVKVALAGSLVTFTFPNIHQPYVILLEAAPTQATMEKYLKDGMTGNVQNRAELYLEQASSHSIVKTMDVAVKVKPIDKARILTDYVPGTVKWHVDYTPYAIVNPETSEAVKLQDTLGNGIDVRKNEDGSLALTDSETGDQNFRIYELTMNNDGTLSEGGELGSVAAYISYDESSGSKVLTFQVPDHTKAYRFYYLTDLTGSVGTNVVNQVKLISKNVNPATPTSQSYVITDADASAFGNRNTRLELEKTDQAVSSKKLKGATFRLQKDGGGYDVTLTTDESGKLVFKGLPLGTYTLTETIAPAGYKKNLNSYVVKVEQSGSGRVITINDIPGPFVIGNEKDPDVDKNVPIIEPQKDDPTPTPPSTPTQTPGNTPENNTPSNNTPDNTPDNTPSNSTPDEPVTVQEDTSEDNVPDNTPPTFTLSELPDPNDSESPERILVVDDEGLPLGTYEKQEKPDGTFEYVLIDDNIPLDIPKTGPSFTSLYSTVIFVLILAAFSIKGKDRREKDVK